VTIAEVRSTDTSAPLPLPDWSSVGAEGDDAVRREGLATLAGSLLAVDPAGLGGAVLLRPTHEAARAWWQALREAMGEGTPLRRLPVGATEDRVLGGLDLAATLATGRRVVMRGLLADAHHGVLVVPLAERMPGGTVSALTEALDSGAVRLERDGVTARHEARVTVVALDESAEDAGDVQVSPSLSDRLAFQLQLPTATRGAAAWPSPAEVRDAKARLSLVDPGTAAGALVAVAEALGVDSLRACVLAARVARAHAALEGRSRVMGPDVEVAAQLVLAPRATRLPPERRTDDPTPPTPAPPTSDEGERDESQPHHEGLPEEILLEAVRALLPPDLLAQSATSTRRRVHSAGRRGRERTGGERGRQLRSAPGRLEGGRRLDAVATLRTAAPWQQVRRLERAAREGSQDPPAATATLITAHPSSAPGSPAQIVPPPAARALDVRRDDFRVRRYKRQTGTTTIIAVDASGSMALQRLAEAKGAVELLLAQTYVRRDKVALIVFRGERAVLLLPPTRALARAKRLLAALPGGGGTPLASAIDVVHATALQAMREGQDVVAVWLTDARANIARDGTPGRPRALEEARRSAIAFRELGQSAVMIDTSPRGEAAARELSSALGARYVPLPSAQARDVARCVRESRATGEVRGA